MTVMMPGNNPEQMTVRPNWVICIVSRYPVICLKNQTLEKKNIVYLFSGFVQNAIRSQIFLNIK